MTGKENKIGPNRISLPPLPVSQTAKEIGWSPVRGLEKLAAGLEEKGILVVRWNIGAPDYGPPAVFFNSLEEYIARARQDAKLSSYARSEGEVDFRRALADQLRQTHHLNELDENKIIITQGSSEAIDFLIRTVAEPGEAIACFEPGYFNYGVIATALGRKIIGIPTKIEDNFRLPPDKQIEDILQAHPEIKAIFVSNPDNPTGRVFTPAEWQRLLQIVARHQLWLVSDEAYYTMVFDNRQPLSLLDVMEEGSQGGVVLRSLSKDYGWPAARLGAIVTYNQQCLDTVAKMAQARGSANKLVQAAAASLREVSDDYFKGHVADYQRRRDFIYHKLQSVPGVKLPPQPPEGAFYLIAQLPVTSAADFCRYLLTDYVEGGRSETLLLTPLVGEDGTGFYWTEGIVGLNQVRIAFIVDQPLLEKGVEILQEALKSYVGKE